MEFNNPTKTLPRIPDFLSMPKTLAAYRLSQEGREETADLRRKFISSKSGRANDQKLGGEISISLRQSKADVTRKSQSSSAPSGVRIKESPRRIGYEPLSPSRSGTRISNEERARLRAKEYIAKHIYKIPTCQRPAFFVKVFVDPRSPMPYPQGTLTSSKCHFTYVKPTKSTDDKYTQLLETSNNAKPSAPAQSLHVSREEQGKRNRLVEQLLSSTKPEEIGNASAVEVEAMKDGPSNNNPTSTQPSSRKPSGHETKTENGKETHLDNLLMPRNSKTVGFCLANNRHYKSIDTTRTGGDGHLGRRQRNSQINQSIDSFTSPRISSADIASGHARHHFIHPEWPSEYISWARYSHPSTSEKFRYSFI